MKLKKIEHKLTVCKVADISEIDMNADFFIIASKENPRFCKRRNEFAFNIMRYL
jgi:hypothetical protein